VITCGNVRFNASSASDKKAKPPAKFPSYVTALCLGL